MLVAQTILGQRVEAHHAKKGEQYYCPYCHEKMILKIGIKVMPHFAHKASELNCCSKGETRRHYEIKYQLAQLLINQGFEVEIEPYIASIHQYPDLLVNNNFALEIQLSIIDIATIIKRTKGLETEGLKVIWILNNLRFSNGTLELTRFQSSFIHPIYRNLIVWNAQQQNLFEFSKIHHIGGRKFLANYHKNSPKSLFKCTSTSHHQGKVYKLSEKKILNYIKQCRKSNSVLQPSLSAIYQLRLTEQMIISKVGYIFHDQIYIETHPIQWQLDYLLLEYLNLLSAENLMKKLKFRTLIFGSKTKIEIVTTLINNYKYILSNRR